MTENTSVQLRRTLAEIAERVAVRLSDHQYEQLCVYLSTLSLWNRRINLTSLDLEGFPAATLERLVGEPLGAISLVRDVRGQWFDIGSGGGSPAIPMAIALSRPQPTLVESRAKKAAFLREVIRRIDMGGAVVLNRRTEQLTDLVAAGSVNLITTRGVRVDKCLVDIVRHLLGPDGMAIFFGEPPLAQLRSAFEIDRVVIGRAVVAVPRGT